MCTVSCGKPRALIECVARRSARTRGLGDGVRGRRQQQAAKQLPAGRRRRSARVLPTRSTHTHTHTTSRCFRMRNFSFTSQYSRYVRSNASQYANIQGSSSSQDVRVCRVNRCDSSFVEAPAACKLNSFLGSDALPPHSTRSYEAPAALESSQEEALEVRLSFVRLARSSFPSFGKRARSGPACGAASASSSSASTHNRGLGSICFG